MIRFLKKILVLKNRRLSIVFIPKSKSCAVNCVYNLVNENFSRSYDLHYVELKSRKLTKNIKYAKTVFFAHPDEEKVGFLNSIDSYPLMPRDFLFNHSQIQTFGFVCHGSHVFSNEYWKKNVEQWISFESEISICTGLKSVDNYWKKYFTKLIEEFSKDDNLSELPKTLKKKINIEIKNLENVKSIVYQVTIACLGSMSKSLTNNN